MEKYVSTEQKGSKSSTPKDIVETSMRTMSQRKGQQNQEEHRCMTCEKDFEIRASLDGHVKEKHERVYECDLCTFLKKSIETLQQHREDTHSKTHKCIKCKKMFLNDTYKAHG